MYRSLRNLNEIRRGDLLRRKDKRDEIFVVVTLCGFDIRAVTIFGPPDMQVIVVATVEHSEDWEVYRIGPKRVK